MSALEKQTVATAAQLPNPQNYDSRGKGKLIMADHETPIKRSFKKAKSEEYYNMTEIGKDVLERMFSVSTNGGIPNGREIKGFLLNYQTLPARIMCVCHGTCFSPAEFLKHASGREVPNPMQFIILRSF